jgi:alcohol-forming fatty acyl-CoA reductase
VACRSVAAVLALGSRDKYNSSFLLHIHGRRVGARTLERPMAPETNPDAIGWDRPDANRAAGRPDEVDRGVPGRAQAQGNPVYWRVEGSLLNLTAVRPLAFFTWNAQTFIERWTRRGGIGLLALVRPLLYSTERVVATRALHTVLRGVSRDRLDLLGEEHFHYVLKPRLKRAGVERLEQVRASGARVVLVGQGLDHVLGPLARHLGVGSIVANRLEFRDGLATGRLLSPVIRPRGALARLLGENPDGRVDEKKLCHDLGFAHADMLREAIVPAERRAWRFERPVVTFDGERKIERFSVREALQGKHVLLVGGTGFIGKVWLADVLGELPEIGRIYLLLRPRRATSVLRRFERLVVESPVFDPLAQRYDEQFGRFLQERVEVLEGDASAPGLGLDGATRERLACRLDLIINSSGLTDFNPDLRDGLASNVDAVAHLATFLRECDHAALLHLSSCYVTGQRDGRIREELAPNYTPLRIAGFDAEQEWQTLKRLIAETEARAESPEVTAELRAEALAKPIRAKELSATSLEHQVRKNRIRWLRQQLTVAGTRRAKELGWPNTYTFTKSLAESLLQARGKGLAIAVVRPSIVESSVERPFTGWNEGINTSASLSYLLGTYFRQFPSNERKLLDIIPVDLVSRGMMLVAAALVQRRHAPLYHLATSASNPCDMRRSIELTGLAHRKHYRAQDGLEAWLRSRFDPIPVSKKRYQRLSVPAQKAILQRINRAASSILRRAPFARQERDLEWVENLIALFEPFILLNEHVFEAENVRLLSEALPEEEKRTFGYDPFAIDWWDYWINIHVPALRRWSYPLIEGRALESRPRAFHWPETLPPARAQAAESLPEPSNP